MPKIIFLLLKKWKAISSAQQLSVHHHHHHLLGLVVRGAVDVHDAVVGEGKVAGRRGLPPSLHGPAPLPLLPLLLLLPHGRPRHGDRRRLFRDRRRLCRGDRRRRRPCRDRWRRLQTVTAPRRLAAAAAAEDGVGCVGDARGAEEEGDGDLDHDTPGGDLRARGLGAQSWALSV